VPFSSFNLHPALQEGVRDLGFTRPTPVQSQAIPPALEGRDVLACAMTGSGKTAAFGLPVLHHLLGKSRGTTRALVLTPTRELAAQIASDLREYAAHTKLTVAPVFGGVGMAPQERAFRQGADVIVATPGRLLDHLGQRTARFDGLTHLVLDEADRMLDMGFLPDIRRVLAHLPERRQTLFFSATMPKPIAQLAGRMLRDPVRLDLQREGGPPAAIEQAVYPVPQHLKPALLLALLRHGDVDQALVFTRTKHRADRVARFLVQGGEKAERIHGNRSQGQRTQALDAFKAGRCRVLVATDIAARGLDVEALGHVINLDIPRAPDDYVHRIGRTGRADRTGRAYTFTAREDGAELAAIERALGRSLPRLALDGFDYGAPAPNGKGAAPAAPHGGPGHHDHASRGGGGGRPGGRSGARPGARKGGGRNGAARNGAVRHGAGHAPGARGAGRGRTAHAAHASGARHAERGAAGIGTLGRRHRRR
jgi:ATP-dependent RNA helicase RhlE